MWNLRTTSSILALAGLAVALAPSPAIGQQTRDGTVTRRLAQSDSGALLRLTFRHPGPQQTGASLGRTGDLIFVSGSGQQPDEIPLPNVARMEIRTQELPFARRAWIGFKIGALLGALILGVAEATNDSELFSVPQGAMFGAFWFGSVGAVFGMGSALGGADAWRPVTTDGWSPSSGSAARLDRNW